MLVNMDNLKEQIRHLISKELGIPSDMKRWKNSTDIFTLVEIDSQSLLGLIIALESEFHIRIDEATVNLKDFKSLISLETLMRRNMNQ